jgi:hypothetical protein
VDGATGAGKLQFASNNTIAGSRLTIYSKIKIFVKNKTYSSKIEKNSGQIKRACNEYI